MYSDIFATIQTKEDLYLIKEEISMLKQSLFKTNSKEFENVLKNELRRDVSLALQKDLQSSKDPKDYLEGLEKMLSSVEQVKIQVAYQLSAKSLASIRDWVSKNITEFVVLDIYYNPSIIAGAAISYKGKYYGSTVSAKIDEYFKNKK